MKRLPALLFFLLLAVFNTTAFATPFPPASNDLQVIRQRIVADLLEPAINSDRIKLLIKTIQPDGSWPDINYKDTTKTGFQHRIHLENMLDLARAIKKQGSPFYGDAAAKKTVSSALDFWLAHDFICENWWWNEMGTPNWMINTLLVLDNDLNDQQRSKGSKIASRASLTGVGARAGGDFVPIAGMVCKQGLFKGNDSILQNAIKVMVAQIEITPARGINPDMGFHHRVDNVTSIHTYGTNYVNAFSYWAVKTEGTQYALPTDKLKLLIDYYIDGISKCMPYAMYTEPGAKNRDLSREGDLEAVGNEIPENLVKATSYRKQELEYIIKVRDHELKPNLTWDKYFWHSGYMAHQRLNYYASVRMYSNRQNNVEEAYNEEGLRNHHLADGSNYISRTGVEYVDIFPVWDWQKIPGTTVVQRPEMPSFREIPKKGLTDFVGAVSDGSFGAAAFDFKSVHDPLKGRKAWFFFDREYVCLGAGINSTSEFDVNTTLNQCLLNGAVRVKEAASAKTVTNGEHQLKVSWILHDSVGYFFLKPTDVHLKNAAATGNWRLISHQATATTEPVTKNVFSLWLDHGKKPDSASYAYVVVPAVNESLLSRYAMSPEVQVLVNNSDMQAVKNKSLDLSQIVFYKAGSLQIATGMNISAKSPCIVMAKLKNGKLTGLSVADPTQKLSSLELEVSGQLQKPGKNFKASWDERRKVTLITVELPKAGMAGQSVVLEMM